jgi:hypothetical protein
MVTQTEGQEDEEGASLDVAFTILDNNLTVGEPAEDEE